MVHVLFFFLTDTTNKQTNKQSPWFSSRQQQTLLNTFTSQHPLQLGWSQDIVWPMRSKLTGYGIFLRIFLSSYRCYLFLACFLFFVSAWKTDVRLETQTLGGKTEVYNWSGLHLKTTAPFLFFNILSIHFLERGEARKRGRETSMCGCLLSAPNWGPGPQLSHVPWLVI